MPKNKSLPSNSNVKKFFEIIANQSWSVGPVPNFRDRDISCLYLTGTGNVFIYLNQITGKFNLHARDTTLRRQNAGCVPTFTHEMVIGDGSSKATADFVNERFNMSIYDTVGVKNYQKLFDEVKEDMLSA